MTQNGHCIESGGSAQRARKEYAWSEMTEMIGTEEAWKRRQETTATWQQRTVICQWLRASWKGPCSASSVNLRMPFLRRRRTCGGSEGRVAGWCCRC